MPLTSKEAKDALIQHLLRVLQDECPYPEEVLEDALDAQEVETKVISDNTLQIKVLPCNSGAWRYFTLKISEQQ
jgi:hypothetical protein